MFSHDFQTWFHDTDNLVYYPQMLVFSFLTFVAVSYPVSKEQDKERILTLPNSYKCQKFNKMNEKRSLEYQSVGAEYATGKIIVLLSSFSWDDFTIWFCWGAAEVSAVFKLFSQQLIVNDFIALHMAFMCWYCPKGVLKVVNISGCFHGVVTANSLVCIYLGKDCCSAQSAHNFLKNLVLIPFISLSLLISFICIFVILSVWHMLIDFSSVVSPPFLSSLSLIWYHPLSCMSAKNHVIIQCQLSTNLTTHIIWSYGTPPHTTLPHP